jgi:hypothetical protein
MAFAPGQLFDPLTFTAEQAAQLNNVAGQSLSATNTQDQLRAAGANIPVDQIGPARPMGITNPQDSGLAGAAVEGARMSAQQFYDMQQYAQTPEQQEAARLRQEAMSGVEQLAGRGAAQLAEEERFGVNALNQELASLNAQILSKTAEYNKLNQSIEGKPITMASIIGEQAQVRKMQASEIGMLQALALGKQGMLSAAQAAADRAIDLKYDDIETQYNIRIKQLELLQPLLDTEEKKRSNALELYLNQEKERVAEQKAAAKNFQNDKLNAIMKGMPVAAAQQVDALFDAGRIDEAYAIMGRYSRSGSTDTFTEGFKNSKIESSVREDAVALMDEVEAGDLELDKAYEKLRRLYSTIEVTDEALKTLLGISAPALDEDAGVTLNPPVSAPRITLGSGTRTGILGKINNLGESINDWFRGL